MLNKDYSFDEFERVLFLDWKEKISIDLKGGSVASLDWYIGDNIRISPFQHLSSVTKFQKLNSHFFNQNQSCLNLSRVSNNNEILEALTNGADGIIIEALDVNSFNETLEGVIPEICHLSFSCVDPISIYASYYNWLLDVTKEDQKVNGFIFQTNLLDQPKNHDFGIDVYTRLLSKISSINGMRFIQISGKAIENQNHSIGQGLSEMCSKLVYFIEKLSNGGCLIDRIISSMFFDLQIGDKFYLEIARIRSLRFLSTLIMKAYGLNKDFIVPIHITTQPKKDFEEISNSTQLMSAYLGGAYSASTSNEGQSSEKKRIARNIINILNEEAYFDKTKNPIEGSYYIENLTEQIIKSTWKIFLENQSMGSLSFEDSLRNP